MTLSDLRRGTTFNANAAHVMNTMHTYRAATLIENSILTGCGEHFHIGFHFANIVWMMDWNFDYFDNAPYAMKTKPKAKSSTK